MSRELENASSDWTHLDEAGDVVLTETLDVPDDRRAAPSPVLSGLINDAARDPFAGDLFATRLASAHAGAAERDPEIAAAGRAQGNVNTWFARLPKVSRDEAQGSELLDRFPDRFAARETLTSVLARQLHETESRIEFRLVERREIAFDELKENAVKGVSGATARVWANIALEPEDAHLCVAVNQAFAIELIGRMLGGNDAGRQADESGTLEGKPRGAQNLRALSKIESAIYEFLWISIVHELNRAADDPALRLHGIARQAPAWLAANGDAKSRAADLSDNRSENGAGTTMTPRGALLTFRIALGETFGLARCYLSDATLAAFAHVRHPFLIEHAQTNERLKSYGRLSAHAESSVQIGTTTVTPAELAALETGDVLKLEQSFVEWRAGEDTRAGAISGELRTRVGAGWNFVIKGYATDATGAATVSLAIETISGGQAPREAERTNDVSMDETTERRDSVAQNTGFDEEGDRYAARDITENAERGADTMNESDARDMDSEGADEAAGNVLDELLMTIHVELAARRMSLEELSRLRPGQIIDLGCRATDPVDLLVDARRIARGELVEIEGGLGVRVISVNG